MEPLLCEHGDNPFSVITRRMLRLELEKRTACNAGNLLTAIKGLVEWMIEEDHLRPDDNPTVGLKTGKGRACRMTEGFIPWEEEDMAAYRTKWPVGTEARLMFDILHYTFLRRGDAHRFGTEHLRRTRISITTEKTGTKVSFKVPKPLLDSITETRRAGYVGDKVFTGKLVKGRIEPMTKESWAKKFKKFAVMAGVNHPKKSCHGVRKARAEDAAYEECTESQMMAMFGWESSDMPTHYIKKARRNDLADRGIAKLNARDQTQDATENDWVTFLGNNPEKL